MGLAISSIASYNQAAQLDVKFGFTPKVSTLTNDKFQLWTVEATPVQVLDPFNPIDVQNDYRSIARILTLNLKAALSPNTTYELRTSGLSNANGTTMVDDADTFETGDIVTPATEPPAPNVEIEDHSVKDVDLSGSGDTLFTIVPAGGSLFSVAETDPVNGSFWVDSDHNDGRITITFTDPVDPNYVTSAYFKVQRKPFSRNPTRWETLAANISSDEEKVYIDFPSSDATPVFYPDDGIYFEDNYKYRVRVSKLVMSTSDAATPVVMALGMDYEMLFSGGITDLYIDPEVLASFFPEASLTEIAEQIHYASVYAARFAVNGEVTDVMLDYVQAAAACALSRSYDPTGGIGMSSGGESVMLGDLNVRAGNTTYGKNGGTTRASASNWCELAAAILRELTRSKAGMKATQKASYWPGRHSSRELKRYK